MKASILFLSLFLLSLTAQVQAQKYWERSISGEGPVVTEELSLADFHSIGLGVSGTVYLIPGKVQKVTVEGQKNLIDNLKREVKNGSWNISFDKNVRESRDMKFYITIPSVKNLSIGGSGKIIAQEAFNGLGALKFSIGGSGTIEFSGSADSADVSIGGSGNIKASNLKVQSCKVSIGGSGSCAIEVGDRLDASIAGSGKVQYKGRPKVNSSVSGSGKVMTMD
jgi:hypothetical protein